jgi:hypothetical protein
VRALPATDSTTGAGAPELDVPTAPVVVAGAVPFKVRGVSAYPAEKRAAEIADRVREVADDSRIPVSDVRTVESPRATRLRAGDREIMLILDADGRVEGVSRQELSLVYVPVLRRAIEEYCRARTPVRLVVAAGRAALATALFAALVALVLFVFRRLDGLVVGRFRRRIDALEARSYEILRAERIRGLFRGTLRTLRAATGDVIEVRTQVTHLHTPKNEEGVIPDSAILQREVINYSRLPRTRGLLLHTTVGIGYEVPWRQVEAMLLMAARTQSCRSCRRRSVGGRAIVVDSPGSKARRELG